MGEFNTQKGAFILVAIVVATQMTITIIIVIACIYEHTREYCDNLREPMLQMFQLAFTAAIAFAGGRLSAPPPPGPKLPETKQEQGEPKDER